MKRLYAILWICCALTSALSQTGTISGFVKDAQTKQPLIGVNIVIEGTFLGAPSDSTGHYIILNIPPGVYKLRVNMMGYAPLIIDKLTVVTDATSRCDIQLKPSVLEGECVTVTADRVAIQKDLTSSVRVVQPDQIEALPCQNVGNVLSLQAGVVNSMPMRGGRLQGLKRSARMSASIAGREPSLADWNTEEYDRIVESDFLDVLRNPLSTFSADVDAASYTNARRFILDNRMPYKDAVRTEEFVNYFTYDYEEPSGEDPISINLEYGVCPWNSESKLVHIGLQGKRLKDGELKPSNLVFLLDVSGSMHPANKLPLLKQSFKMLVDELRPDDRVAIVVYAGAAGLVLSSTPGSEKKAIKQALGRLEAGGSTAGGAGLKLAYQVAQTNLFEGGNNRVILATDGDFNIGISSTSELVDFIEKKRDEGIFLTALGFGMGNYKDHRLQELADRGNGNHYYIDNIKEARKVFVRDLQGTLFTIAKDVKIQVEFNPTKIASYRLIGYENRRLKNEDFEDDKKDAGEMGSGHTVTALYEVFPVKTEQIPDRHDLKYQHTLVNESANESDEILEVRIRYKQPDGKTSKQIKRTLVSDDATLAKTSGNFQFSAAVAQFALLLRDSKFKADATLENVLELARSSKGDDFFGYRSEFIDLVDRVSLLMPQVDQTELGMLK